QLFQHQLAAAYLVKGKHHHSKGTEQPTETASHARLHLGTIDPFTAQCPGHCTIGRQQRRIRSEPQPFQQRGRIGGPPARGNGHRNSCILCRLEGSRRARAHLLRKRGQQGSIHVDSHEANGRVHTSSVPGHLRCGSPP